MSDADGLPHAGGIAFVDQAIVSGTRFLITLVLGRFAGADELGLYAVAFAVLVLTANLQEAFVTTPYTVYGCRLAEPQRRVYAGNVLLQHGTLALAVAAGFLLAVPLLRGIGVGAPFVGLIGAMALVAPAVLLWELARRVAIAHLRLGEALAIDAATSSLQIALIGAAMASGQLSALTAYGCVAVACLLVGVVWLWARRRMFRLDIGSALAGVAPHWRFGRWVFASQAAQALQRYSLLWLVAAQLGATAAGGFAACQNLMLMANPALLGMSNLFAPALAHSSARGGREAVLRLLRAVAVRFAPVIAAISVLLAFFAGDLLTLLFGEAYRPYRTAAHLLAPVPLAWAAHMAFSGGLRALERPRAAFQGDAAGLVSGVGLALVLTPLWGVAGAAAALVGCSTITAALQSWALFRSRDASDTVVAE